MWRAWKWSLPPVFTTEKLHALKMDDFPWTHQRTEVTGPTPTLDFGEMGKSRVTAEICLPGAEAAGAIRGSGPLNCNFEENAGGYEPGGKWETCEAYAFMGLRWALSSRNPTAVTVKIQEGSSCDFGVERERAIIMKYSHRVVHNKGIRLRR